MKGWLVEDIELRRGEPKMAKGQQVRWHRDWLLLPVIGAVFLADQVTKMLVESTLRPGQSIPEEGTFRITYTVNTGSAFGLFPNQTLFLILASFVGIGVLILLFRHQPFSGALPRLSLGLQLGGALGNLVDRIREGEVLDFIQLGFWPVFNLADASIVVGIIILAWLLMGSRSKARPPSIQTSVSPGQGDMAMDYSDGSLDPVEAPSSLEGEQKPARDADSGDDDQKVRE